MNEFNNPIKELKIKIEKLMFLHNELKNKNESLQNELEILKLNIEKEKIARTEFEQIKKELLQNNTNEKNSTITETKFKINELVQEIDNCIALLK